MNKNNYYVKKFQESYSLSREAELIQYLNQRGAQVPKLISTHPKGNVIKMQYVGKSLLDIFNSNIEKKINEIKVLKILRESVNIGHEISNLEVWHYDLALRNFTFLETQESISRSVFLIDFSAAISPLYLLQKPLWLRPDTRLHHKELIQALEKDWTDFFKKNFLDVPKIIDNEFTIPIEKYNNYWNSQLNVQKLKNPVCVIAHSLGVMINNFLSIYSEPMPQEKKNKLDNLKKIALELKNLRSSIVAYDRINKSLDSLDLIIKELEISSSETPRPRISPKIENNRKVSFYTKNTKAIGLNRATKENILPFLILYFGFFVTNEAYEFHNIVLSDIAFIVALVVICSSILYFFLVLTTWKFFKFVKIFLRFESMLLFYYFFELSYFETGWLFLSLIFISVVSIFALTTKYIKKILN